MNIPARQFMVKTISMLILSGLLGVSCSRANNSIETRPPADLFGNELVKADGSRIDANTVTDKDIVAVYFSAQWCPPCRAFTPILVETANVLQAEGKSFGVLFVSSDRSKEEMLAYMEEYDMPWAAVPHHSDTAEELSLLYGVRGIPMLVVIDREGNLLSANGRGDVTVKGAAAFDDWAARSPALQN